jgi:type II secretory pathway component PulF
MEEDVKKQLAQQMKEKQAGPPPGAAPGMFSRASRVEVACFYRSFSILMASEYPLPRALAMLANSTSNQDLSRSIKSMADRVEAGEPLSRCMASFPWYFDRVACATAQAAEETAQLEGALNFLADTVESEIEVRERASQALTYPALVMGMSIIVVVGVLYFVVPMFEGYMQDSGIEPTGIAAFVYGLSALVRFPLVPIVVVVGLIAAGWGGFTWRRNNPVGFYRSMGRIPILGGIMLQASLARFVAVFRMLVVNDIPVPKALELSVGTVENAHLQRIIRAMQSTVEQGRAMADVLKGQSGLPPIFVDMMSLAEETGRLDDILAHLARTLNAELGRKVGRLSGAAEPIMLVVLGVTVMIIMLSFFMPYLQMLGALGAG